MSISGGPRELPLAVNAYRIRSSCAHQFTNDLLGDAALAVEPDPFYSFLAEEGLRFEEAVGAALRKQIRPYTVVSLDAGEKVVVEALRRARTSKAVIFEGDPREGVRVRRWENATFQILAEPGEVRYIWNPSLPRYVKEGRRWRKSRRSGRPDLLVRTRGGWVPVDVKNHRVVGDDGRRLWKVSPIADPERMSDAEGDRPADPDILQLCHYWRMLEFLGVDTPEAPVGGLIGSDRPDSIVWVPLGDVPLLDRGRRTALSAYDERYAAAEAVAEAIERREVVTAPAWGPECRPCRWRDHCFDVLSKQDHPTLLAGVTPARAAALAGIGVKSIPELARVAPSSHDMAWLPSVVDQARVVEWSRRRRMDHIYRRRGVPDVSVPWSRSRLFVDVETAPPHNSIYMWGAFLLTDEAGEYRCFVRWEEGDRAEVEVFGDFWRWYLQQVEMHPDLLVYHWSAAEPRCVRHIVTKHAGPGLPAVDEAEAEMADRWVDLYRVVADQLVLPVPDYTLKSVGKYARFAWRDEDPSGASSQVWYRAAVDPDSDPDERGRWRARIVEYNEDDVRACSHILDFLRRLTVARKSRIPAVETLDRMLAEA